MVFGINTYAVEHVLITSTLTQDKPQNFFIRVDSTLDPTIASKDIFLHICGIVGTVRGAGCAIEFTESAIRALPMEA